MKKKNFLSRTFLSFAWWYKITCNYGESTSRPIILLSILLISATMLFFYEEILGFQILYKINSDVYNRTDIITSALYNGSKRSVSTLSPFFELQKTELSDYVIRLLTLPLIGTLFIALRRNLERRFRH